MQPIFHYVLPELRLVTLARCYFARYPDEDAEARLTNRLLNCLMERYEYGAEIEQLRVMHAVNITEEEISWLAEVVRTMDWDSIVDYEEEVNSIVSLSDGYDDEDDFDSDGSLIDDPYNMYFGDVLLW
ncbi:hypothetical protein DAEQUDRAFT_814646 [Daedalea quercina L-15889]|uniref:Uncharacterized protein n=1 Tax=Daedalea quercina L-15889 TaxID=1314783 RepID=A0A165LWL7_9APHY|nr:hypothetical protein DAEQUDRAFT_814646 [Daedalea quercina L-15889]